MTAPPSAGFRTIDEFVLSDLDSIWNILRGDSVIDWKRLNFPTREDVREFIRVQEFDPDDAGDKARMEAVKAEAVQYLRRNFEYPIPKSIAEMPVEELMLTAASKGHKQVCACVILKKDCTATKEELIEFVREGLSKFKAPRYVLLMDSFPMTASGKIQKFKLREMGVDLLGLHAAANIETA